MRRLSARLPGKRPEMPPAPPGITQPPWSTMFPAHVVAIVSAIVGGVAVRPA